MVFGQPEDRIVVVVGPTGAGKSTFIVRATGRNPGSVGHGWQSQTSDIQTIRVRHPKENHYVVFVDTPGFDDTYKTDTEILTTIADWFVKKYKGKANFATILYFHRISDNRMSGTAMKNLRLFRSLCGKDAMPNIIIVTTMWSKVTEEEGIEWQTVLKNEVWNDMLDQGCSVERFANTRESAWHVIDSLSGNDRANVLVSSEIVDHHLRLNETQAGGVLSKELERLIKAQKEAERKLKQAGNHDDSIVREELSEIETKISQTVDEFQRLKIPFTRKILLFFFKKKNG